MGGRYKPMTAAQVAKAKRQRRGEIRIPYTPYFEGTQIRSKGRLVRVQSIKTGRVVNLPSELEGSNLLLADFDPAVTEHYENVALDLTKSYTIARRLRRRHIRSRAKGRPLVPMTTDLVVRFGADDPQARSETAVNVKYRSDFTGRRAKRNAGQLLIESTYHAVEGRSHCLSTDEYAPMVVIANLTWLREALLPGAAAVSPRKQKAFEIAFKDTDPEATIRDRIDSAAATCRLTDAGAIDAFRRAVWFQRIKADLNTWLRLGRVLCLPTSPNQGVNFPWDR